MDLPPVLARRVEGPIMSLNSLQKNNLILPQRGDAPPTMKRSTEEPARRLSLDEILIDLDDLEDLGADFLNETVGLEPLTNVSTHTV